MLGQGKVLKGDEGEWQDERGDKGRPDSFKCSSAKAPRRPKLLGTDWKEMLKKPTALYQSATVPVLKTSGKSRIRVLGMVIKP